MNPPSGGGTKAPHTLEDSIFRKAVKSFRVDGVNHSVSGQNIVNSSQRWPTESSNLIDSGDSKLNLSTLSKTSSSKIFDRKLKISESVNQSESKKYDVIFKKYSTRTDENIKSIESESSYNFEGQRHLDLKHVDSKKLTPDRNTKRGKIQKASLKTPLKTNIKKLKNEFKKSLTPEKPELLKLFEKMGEKKALKSVHAQKKISTDSVDFELGLSNKSKYSLTSEPPREKFRTKCETTRPKNDPVHSINIEKSPFFKVKKVSLGTQNPKVAVLPEIDGIIREKLIDDSDPKSAQDRTEKVLDQESIVVVRSPNPSLRKISRTPNVQLKRQKSVKELRKEVELRSTKPITNYFSKKKLVLDAESEGVSNFKLQDEEHILRLDSRTKPKTAVGHNKF